MSEESIQHVLGQYDRDAGRYEGFAEKIKELVEEMLGAAEVDAHAVTSRLKGRDSLHGKLLSPTAHTPN